MIHSGNKLGSQSMARTFNLGQQKDNVGKRGPRDDKEWERERVTTTRTHRERIGLMEKISL